MNQERTFVHNETQFSSVYDSWINFSKKGGEAYIYLLTSINNDMEKKKNKLNKNQ